MLCSLLGFDPKSSSRSMSAAHAITLGLSRYALVLGLDKSHSWPSAPYCVIASIRPQLLEERSSGACFSAQLIIILLISRDFHPIPAPSLARRLARAAIPLAGSQPCSVALRVSFRSRLFSELLSLFEASANSCALYTGL